MGQRWSWIIPRVPIAARTGLLLPAARAKLLLPCLPAFHVAFLLTRVKIAARQGNVELVDLDAVQPRRRFQLAGRLHLLDLASHPNFEGAPLPRLRAIKRLGPAV